MNVFLDANPNTKTAGTQIINLIRAADSTLLVSSPYVSRLEVEEFSTLFSNIKSVKIIVDLYSGACDPYVLLSLRSLANVRIRFRSNLHAKVFNNYHSIIVGSANLTKPGLYQGNIEAVVESDNETAILQCAEWFESLWKDSLPIENVNQAEWDSLIAKWRLRSLREQRTIPHFSDLLFADELTAYVFTTASMAKDWVKPKDLREFSAEHHIVLPKRFHHWVCDEEPNVEKLYEKLGYPSTITLNVKCDEENLIERFTSVSSVSKFFGVIPFVRKGQKQFVEIHESIAKPDIDISGKQSNRTFIKLLNKALKKNKIQFRIFEENDEYGTENLIPSSAMLNILLKDIDKSALLSAETAHNSR